MSDIIYSIYIQVIHEEVVNEEDATEDQLEGVGPLTDNNDAGREMLAVIFFFYLLKIIQFNCLR